MRRSLCILIVCAAQIGCVHSSTEELSLGGAVDLDAISPSTVEQDDLLANAGVGRDQWPTQVIIAPNDQTTELPRFVSHPGLASDSPRRRGERPTALSSVELDVSESGPLAELLVAPFIAGLDVLLIPFRTSAPDVVVYERGRERPEATPVVMPIENEHE